MPQDLPNGAAFGQSISIDPWFLVIGAFAEDVPVVNAGAAYVYGLWGPIDLIGGPCCVITAIDARLSLPTPGNTDFLGLSVRADTPYMLVSVSGHDTPSAGNVGGVALFRLEGYPDD